MALKLPRRVARGLARRVGGPTTEDLSRTLKARFEGPAVAHGRVSVATFARVMERLQEALVVVAEDMAGRTHTRGPVPQAIRETVTLELAAIRRGSFAATCELRPPGSGKLPDTVAEDALDKLMRGIRDERRGFEPDLPIAAQGLVREFLRLEEGITRLTLNGGRSKVKVIFEERVHQGPLRAARRNVEVTGYVWELDYKDNTAEVWTEGGRRWRIDATAALMEEMDRVRRRRVTVAGEEDPARPQRLSLGAIHPAAANGDFWGVRSIETLATEQGVKPFVYDIQDPAEVWPEDDQVEFLTELAAMRAQN